MIGHYLLSLTPEQEDRVLTQTFRPVMNLTPETSCRCLVMTAEDKGIWWQVGHLHESFERQMRIGVPNSSPHPGYRYESACVRFGIERVNAAIRNRILANRARRALRNSPPALRETVSETQEVGR